MKKDSKIIMFRKGKSEGAEQLLARRKAIVPKEEIDELTEQIYMLSLVRQCEAIERNEQELCCPQCDAVVGVMIGNHRENGIVDGNFCSTCGTSLVLGQLRKRKLH